MTDNLSVIQTPLNPTLFRISLRSIMKLLLFIISSFIAYALLFLSAVALSVPASGLM